MRRQLNEPRVPPARAAHSAGVQAIRPPITRRDARDGGQSMTNNLPIGWGDFKELGICCMAASATRTSQEANCRHYRIDIVLLKTVTVDPNGERMQHNGHRFRCQRCGMAASRPSPGRLSSCESFRQCRQVGNEVILPVRHLLNRRAYCSRCRYKAGHHAIRSLCSPSTERTAPAYQRRKIKIHDCHNSRLLMNIFCAPKGRATESCLSMVLLKSMKQCKTPLTPPLRDNRRPNSCRYNVDIGLTLVFPSEVARWALSSTKDLDTSSLGEEFVNHQ